jgi:hypothetical protein
VRYLERYVTSTADKVGLKDGSAPGKRSQPRAFKIE